MLAEIRSRKEHVSHVRTVRLRFPAVQKEYLILHRSAGVGMGRRFGVYVGCHDHILLRWIEGRTIKCLIEPYPKSAGLPCNNFPLVVVFLAVQAVFADDKILIVVLFQNQPFNGFLSVAQVPVLFISAEEKGVAGFSGNFRLFKGKPGDFTALRQKRVRA